MNKDHYQTLGVLEDAEDIVIRAAYRALAQKYHPDKWHGNPAEAKRKMQEINDAYYTLSDPIRRSDYDKSRQQGEYKESSTPEQENPNVEILNDWNIAISYYPDLVELDEGLQRFSNALAFSYKVKILETKDYSHRNLIAQKLEDKYLRKYFGEDEYILMYAREWILEGRKDAAKELNDAIRVIGTKVDLENIVRKISEKYQTKSYTVFKNSDATNDKNFKTCAMFFVVIFGAIALFVIILNLLPNK